MGGMLRGVRIIDMTSVVFGPYATQMLAGLGADVIKVEAPQGDQFRYSGKPAASRGMSPGFMALNCGKRSIVLDLKTEEDRAVLGELIRTADIFIHNVRLKAIEALGFAPDQLEAINPGLIYIHCTGFGSGGPYDGLQAYDDVIQAASGAATLSGRVDGTGTPRYIPSLIADKVAGLYGAQAALAAYVHKLRTGEGQFVEVPMFEAFTHFMMAEHLGGLTFDPPNAPEGYFRQIDPDRQPFPTKDGHISIVPYTADSWPVVFEVAEDADFLHRAGINTPKDQVLKQHLLYRRLAELTPQRTTADWVARFTQARIPCMPVRDLAHMLEDPHLKETGFFKREEHPTEGTWYQMSSPVRYACAIAPPQIPPPLTGEHTEQIRADIQRHFPHIPTPEETQ
ncbi:L-carnitine dehydratase/bile acid-inducible protein F [Hyphomonas polymorpha PS728]|uniref:L-carnitine dehydratase/bile acid-inducible protein F n=1 Tax=Hyphomonas polymorpha PS728 TaxID=1280954 RepID=A0A062VDU7_9PROT|nr:CoA transferase [Hyphomonas polymorpha]KCZ97610.1 L-carnitine dehydratase/bile acid-inducible protein F [Hyphomonas polymorpha PS728]